MQTQKYKYKIDGVISLQIYTDGYIEVNRASEHRYCYYVLESWVRWDPDIWYHKWY